MTWVSIFIAGILTYFTRMSMVTLIRKEMISDNLRKILNYVPSVVFPSIIFPGVLLDDFGTFVSISEDLDANPPVVPIEVNGQPLEAQVSSVEGWSGIYQALYEENQIALLPFLAVALQMNSTDMLSPIFSDGYGSALGLGDGMSMSVECSELPYSWDLEKETEIIENPGDWAKKLSTSHRSYCSVWPVELVNPHFAEPVSYTHLTLPTNREV